MESICNVSASPPGDRDGRGRYIEEKADKDIVVEQ